MMGWKENLNKYFNGDIQLYERNYKITYPCRYKVNGAWEKAKIDLEHGKIYNLNGEVIRECIKA